MLTFSSYIPSGIHLHIRGFHTESNRQSYRVGLVPVSCLLYSEPVAGSEAYIRADFVHKILLLGAKITAKAQQFRVKVILEGRTVAILGAAVGVFYNLDKVEVGSIPDSTISRSKVQCFVIKHLELEFSRQSRQVFTTLHLWDREPGSTWPEMHGW